jgi:hypothetical protein
MGVPVARPHGRLDGRRKEKNCECENICQCNNTCECDTPFSSALDMDGLSAEILKMCGSAVVEWNSASMLEAGPGSPSVQEKGSKHDKKNYCPESLLPAGSKILEDVVRSQLEKHLKKWGIIPREQHGFRAARSTSTAAQCLVHDCCDMKNKGKEVGLVLFDLSSAFDLVDASILVEKLKIYGVGETACKWVLSYMFGRRQLVQIGQSQSSLQPISYGVPQGGTLLPLLFVVFTADMPEAVKGAELVIYADDTSAWSGRTTGRKCIKRWSTRQIKPLITCTVTN